MLNNLSPSMLAWLRSFEATARLRSVTRAADELCITQGAVSQQVRHLEKALGFALLLRRSAGLELTPEGQKLAPVLHDAFTAVRDILAEISAPGGMAPVTLSCSPSFALQWLAPRLSNRLKDQPNVDLRVFGEFHRLDRNTMGAEGLEAAIRYDRGVYADLRVESFLDEYLIAVTSPQFLAAHPELLSQDEVDGRLFLHDARPWMGAEDDAEWKNFLAGAKLRATNLALGQRFNLSQLATGAALAGDGVAIGRLATILDDLEAGRLVAVLPIAVRSIATYNFISTQERPARISAVLRWLKAEAEGFQERRGRFLAAFTIVDHGDDRGPPS